MLWPNWIKLRKTIMRKCMQGNYLQIAFPLDTRNDVELEKQYDSLTCNIIKIMMLGILMVDMAMMLILKNTLFAPADPWKSHLSLHCHSSLPPSQYLCQVFSIFASGIYTCDICRGYLLFFTSFNLPFRVFLGGPLNFKADSIWNSHSPMPKKKVFFSEELPLIQIWS